MENIVVSWEEHSFHLNSHGKAGKITAKIMKMSEFLGSYIMFT